MDWPLAIARNKDAMKQIIAALFTLAGLTSPRNRGEEVRAADRRGAVTFPRHLIAAILLILRPAESAVRRLVLLAALCRKPGAACLSARHIDPGLAARMQALPKLPPAFRTPAFALLDPLISFDPDTIWNADPTEHIRFQSSFDTGLDPATGFRTLPDSQQPVSAAAIVQRLHAISHALDTLPQQARRLLRWQKRRDVLLQGKTPYKPVRITPIRPGLPPGWRQRSVYEVDHVLRECHRLAMDVMNAPDTG
jgi:hypothetical protein